MNKVILSFDSILVRLKEMLVRLLVRCFLCFDSILVRLKDGRATACRKPYDNLFRFHTGSIKSHRTRMHGKATMMRFRFHTGSIKRRNVQRHLV